MTRILITGAAGQLGHDLVLAAEGAGLEVRRLDRQGPDPCDLADHERVEARVADAAPDVVVHAGAWTAVDACEADPERAMAVNAGGTGAVARGAAAVGAHVLYVSTDYVFDGTKVGPYTEHDEPAPRSVYGRSKLAGERALDPGATIVRTSWVCGEHGANMVKTVLRLADAAGPLRFVADQVGRPTFTADLAPVLVDLAVARASGTFHVTNRGAVSWYEFARAVLEAAGLDAERVEPIATADLDPPRPAPRPSNSVLADDALVASGRPPLRDFRAPLAELVRRLRGDGASAASALGDEGQAGRDDDPVDGR